jgi:phosphoglycerol transferase
MLDERVSSSSGQVGSRVRALAHRRPAAVSVVVTALLSTGLFLVGFGGWVGRLASPLGGGDLLPAYAAARLWSQGAVFGDASLGYPFGMEQRYYPTADVVQNLLAGLVTRATDNPFLGINVVFAVSFPVTALAALWVFRIAGLRTPLTVVAALALTFIPYHWYRFAHIHLATMYSAVLGVGLALLVGNGTVERRLRSTSRLRFILALMPVVVLIAASGVYYACFTVLLCVAASLYRVLSGARWRDVALSAAPALAVAVALATVLAPATLFAWANPPLEPVAQRDVAESVMYGGALVFALLPAPSSGLPGFGAVTSFSRDALSVLSGYPLSEVHSYSNFGSVATVAALVIFAMGGLVLARRSAAVRTGNRTRLSPPVVSLGLVGMLLASVLLFFIPWGLSYLFAYMITPDLRGWNRLVPVLFVLLFVGAGLVLQRLRWRLPPARAALVAAVALAVLLFDSVLPYRSVFADYAAEGSEFGAAGNAYATALNAAVPGHCGVLQLPFVGYPEVPPPGRMGDYEHLWPAVTNPGKSWSYGAMKGTSASAWQATLGSDVDAADLPELQAGGFCAVHVDRRGYSSIDAASVTGNLAALLGAPVAVGLKGQWVAFALPSPVVGNPDVDRLVKAPGGVGTFYAPPTLSPGRGVPDEPQETRPRTIWRLHGGSAAFDVTSAPAGLPFSSVRGELHAGKCAQKITLTLRSGDSVATESIDLAAGGWTTFAVTLDGPRRNASFSVTKSVPECQAEPGTDAGLALVDPRAAS